MKKLINLSLCLSLFLQSSPAMSISLDNVMDFGSHALKRALGLDSSNHACDSVGIMVAHKKIFAKENHCSLNEVTEDKIQLTMEKLLGMDHRETALIFQKDAALIALTKAHDKELEKKINYQKRLSKEFETIMNYAELPPKAEALGILKSSAEVFEKILIPGVIAHSKDSDVNLDEIMNLAFAVSPLLSFVKEDIKTMIQDSARKTAPVDPADFNHIKLSRLFYKASEIALKHQQDESNDAKYLVEGLLKDESKLNSREKKELKNRKKKYTEKLVINNPRQAAEVIEGILVRPKNGLYYIPTQYSVLARGLCELESNYFEVEANKVQDDFFVAAGTAPLAFVGGGVGALFLLGYSVYNLGHNVPEAFKTCTNLKLEFEKENSMALSQALHTPMDQMSDPLSPHEAQAIALSECAKNAGIQTGFAVASAALAGAGLGGLGRSVAGLARSGKISAEMGKALSKVAPALQTTSLYGGRAVGLVSVGISTKEYFDACQGDNVDQERCRVAKLTFANAGIGLVGSEVNRKYIASQTKKNRNLPPPPKKEDKKTPPPEKEEMIRKPPPAPETLALQKEGFIKSMKNSPAHTEVKTSEAKAETFEKLSFGDEVQYFDPNLKRPVKMVYVGKEGDKKIFLKDPVKYVGAVREKVSSPQEFESRTGGSDDAIYFAKPNSPESGSNRARLLVPEQGDYLVTGKLEGEVKLKFPAKISFDPKEDISGKNGKQIMDAIVIGREKGPEPRAKENLIIVLPGGRVEKIKLDTFGGKDKTALTPLFTVPPEEQVWFDF